ncbi:hypothetical protein EGR_10312 [Echinococcus granulosus]|uniref:Uncharacterized protein n=1 Tax=Echinococcus granulosus TaxID=6210 RepID=W6U8M1_ECHGR|nr:hypothetical protein EGR_10312 [Echinococcus granulosus]EUB54827.1 hypothetical protein EGR_10312 [Echinococcus granulosus]
MVPPYANVYKIAYHNRKHRITALCSMRIFAIVITCLIVVGFGYPTHPTFPSYQTAVRHSSANTGYRCRAGICGYRCSSPWCHGFESALYPQMAMQEMWGSGAHGRHAHSRTMTEFLMKASPEDLTMLIESTPNIDEAITTTPQNNLTPVSNMERKVTEGVLTTVATHATLFTDERLKLDQSEIPSTSNVWTTPDQKNAISSNDLNVYTSPQSITTTLQKNPTLVEMKSTEVARTTSTSNAPIYTDKDLEFEQSEIPSTDNASKRPNVVDEISGSEVDTYTPPQAITTTPQNNLTPFFSMVMKVTEGAPTTATTETRDPADMKFDLIRSKIPLIDLPLRLHDPRYRVKLRQHYVLFKRAVDKLHPNGLKAVNVNLTIAKQSLDKAHFMLVESHLEKAKEYTGRGIVNKSEKCGRICIAMTVGLPYVRDIVTSMDARLLQRMITYIPNIDAISSSANPVISQLTMPNMPRTMPMAERSDAKMSQADRWMCDRPNSMDPKSMEYFMSTMLKIPT